MKDAEKYIKLLIYLNQIPGRNCDPRWTNNIAKVVRTSSSRHLVASMRQNKPYSVIRQTLKRKEVSRRRHPRRTNRNLEETCQGRGRTLWSWGCGLNQLETLTYMKLPGRGERSRTASRAIWESTQAWAEWAPETIWWRITRRKTNDTDKHSPNQASRRLTSQRR